MFQEIGIILAAGKGTRMKSRFPKVLHQVGGKPMMEHVIRAVKGSGISQIIAVIGHEAELVRTSFGDNICYAFQENQLGTGHAILSALPHISQNEGTVLVVCGDTPLIRQETLRGLLDKHREAKAVCTVMTAEMPDPAGYGRIVRDQGGSVIKIVEQKDAAVDELKIKEINTGTYCFDLAALREGINSLTTKNAQGEYYLTDTVSYFVAHGQRVQACLIDDYRETGGINSRAQLAEADRVLRERKITELLEQGVTIVDPATTFIDVEVVIGSDTVVEPFTFIRGNTVIGSDCLIGAYSDLKDCRLANGITVLRSMMVDAKVGDGCNIGPFAYLRPGTELHQKVKIGDFVEVKKSVVGTGSKIPHLSYVGDSVVGQNVNIGCGTVTCNYDGKHKHQTIIGDGSFIGSNTNLVAPVEVGKGAFTAAGSTITKNVPENDLALARAKQINFPGWAEKKRQEQAIK